MRTPLVFSYTRDQSLFMTAIMSLLTFLAVLTLGIALAIGTGVSRWNSQWDLYATVQIMSDNNAPTVQKILKDNVDKFDSVTEVPKADMEKMLRPWLSGSSNQLGNYLPKMYEIKFKKKNDIAPVGEELSKHARFLTHASALKNSTSSGWRMIWIASLVLIMTLAAITVCISYIARNTAMLHKRELEILNQIGAKDLFIAKQMQIIVARICSVAGLVGFVCALPVLALILSAARNARVGLMAMMGLGSVGWIILILMPIAIIILSIWITQKTTLKILENS